MLENWVIDLLNGIKKQVILTKQLTFILTKN